MCLRKQSKISTQILLRQILLINHPLTDEEKRMNMRIHSGVKIGEKPYLCSQQISLHCRMAKGINLPTNSGSHTELIFDKPMPKGCLINHVNVICGSLIMHAHTPISAPPEFENHNPNDEHNIKSQFPFSQTNPY